MRHVAGTTYYMPQDVVVEVSSCLVPLFSHHRKRLLCSRTKADLNEHSEVNIFCFIFYFPYE